jgi:hypothetical protein
MNQLKDAGKGALTPALSHRTGEGESSAVFRAAEALGSGFLVRMHAQRRKRVFHEAEREHSCSMRDGENVRGSAGAEIQEIWKLTQQLVLHSMLGNCNVFASA